MPVTYFPQHRSLMWPSSAVWMNLLQMHMYKQLRIMIPPGMVEKKMSWKEGKICLKSHAGSNIDQKTQMACQCHSIIMY